MKKVKVNEDLCIACGACMQIAPNEFKFNDAGLSEAKVSEVDDNNADVITAMESCPTGAIIVEDSDEKKDCDRNKCECEHCDSNVENSDEKKDCDCDKCECEHCDCNHEE